ncbi:MAG: aspartate kinase [Myxococcales bacterium]|nr:aspartate kinase [Myxococcales bacterium]
MSLSSITDKPIVVQKYGGSSVADSAHLLRVAERIVKTRESGKHVVVVVSAMARATDDLLARAREVAKAPSRRELDMLLSCGERASMALLAMAVHELGHEAVSLTGSQSGIMTNDRHSGARIIEVRPLRVEDELARDKIVIVAGFQGVSYKREITTLGRGGSDTTAVALAAALGAEYCEICSDVDGIYSADPRIVDDAELLEAIRCDEMLELAAHGARVLHPGCVEIAKRSDVRLYARATAKTGGGTRVDAIGAPERRAPSGVTGMCGLVRMRGETIDELLEMATRESLGVLHIDSVGDAGEMWISLADQPDWAAVRSRVQEEGGLSIDEKVGAVSVVAEGLGQQAARIRDIRRVASEADVEMLGMSTSPLRVTLFCRELKVDVLVQALQSSLF